MDILLEIVLNICAQSIKVNVKGTEEMAHVLGELGVGQKEQPAILKVFQTHCLTRLEHINNAYEDQSVQETAQVDGKTLKKFPLNFSAADDMLCVSNPRLVDVDWKVIHTLSSKNLNKLFEPRFQITLTFLTQQGSSLQQGAESMFPWSIKRNHLKLKRMEFECDQTELTHLLFKVKSATNSLEQMTKT